MSEISTFVHNKKEASLCGGEVVWLGQLAKIILVDCFIFCFVIVKI
jgi:hypothetical protein